MKKLLLLLIIPFLNYGQSCSYNGDIDYSNICNQIRNNFTSNEDADLALDNILDAGGLAKNFALVQCDDINNCLATEIDGTRFIIYDGDFMRGVANKDYAKMSIFAHEVGHHINGHLLGDNNLISLSKSRQQELEADEWSGRMMFLMGYSLEQAQKAVYNLHNGINEDDSFSTHPSLNKRINAIELGWINAQNQMQTLGGKLDVENTKNNDNYIPQSARNNNTSTNNNINFFDLAREFFNNEDYNSAILNYTKAINSDFEPKEMAYVNRGLSYSRSGNNQKAKSDYSTAIKINPEYGLAYNNRAVVKSKLGESFCDDYILACNYDYELACEYYEVDCGGTSYSAEEYFYMAYDVHDEDPKLASEYYTKAIKNNYSGKKYAYFNRALCYGELKDFNLAISDYSSAIRLDSKYANAYFNRAIDKSIVGDESYCNDLKLACDNDHEKACKYFKEENCNITYSNANNNSSTSGSCQGDCENGWGTYTWPDGGKYVGDWVDGEQHGRGTKSWASGDKYVGDYLGGSRTGKGTYTWLDGGKYVGDYLDGKQHGRGTYTWPNGSKYVGDWVDGEQHGRGTKSWASGDKYVGDYLDGSRTGKGTYTWPSGSKYVGDYLDGQHHGRGTYTWPDGDKYVGDWLFGKHHGYGKYIYANGSEKSGKWENGSFVD